MLKIPGFSSSLLMTRVMTITLKRNQGKMLYNTSHTVENESCITSLVFCYFLAFQKDRICNILIMGWSSLDFKSLENSGSYFRIPATGLRN